MSSRAADLEARQALVEALYDRILPLPHCDYRTPSSSIPRNGIYLFFEQGEDVVCGGAPRPRIVRVGSHRGEGRLPKRIRLHYGPQKSLGGNKDLSVFRRHLGAALLARTNQDDPRVLEWFRKGGRRYREVEEEVSRCLRDWFRFVCFRVDERDERFELEAALIGLLASTPMSAPSPGWLGRHAIAEPIRRTGLWNTMQTTAAPLSPQGLGRVAELIAATLRGG
jgi:hypothetical protein